MPSWTTERLDKSTPLQRAILHVLRDGRHQTVGEVFQQLELHTPPGIHPGTASAVYHASARALERLVDDGLASSDRLGGTARYAATGVTPDAARSGA